MAKLKQYRSLLISVFGILSLGATLGSAPLSSATASSDISVSITADRNVVKVGQNVTYTVTATNRGPNDATFVDFAIQLPAQFSEVRMVCGQGISPDGPFCEYSSLPAGTTVVSTLVATPKPGMASRTRMLTTSVSTLFENTDVVDPDLSNNAASVQTKLVGRLTRP